MKCDTVQCQDFAGIGIISDVYEGTQYLCWKHTEEVIEKFRNSSERIIMIKKI